MKKVEIKKLRILFVALLVAASVGTTQATGKIKVIPVPGKKMAKIVLAEPGKDKLELSVQTMDGYTKIYREDLAKMESFNKVFDFTHLEDGQYKIVTKTDVKVYEQNITIVDGKIEVNEANEKYLPFFKVEKDKLFVSYLNLDGENVEVSFADQADTFFKENVENKTVSKIYDLAKLANGFYYIKLAVGDRTYTYDFRVN